jgi:hypothetical protein
MGIEKAKRDATRPRLSGRHDDFGATYRKRQCAQCRAFHKAASADVRHRISSRSDFFLYPENVGAFPVSQQDGNGADDAFAFVRSPRLDLNRREKKCVAWSRCCSP